MLLVVVVGKVVMVMRVQPVTLSLKNTFEHLHKTRQMMAGWMDCQTVVSTA